MKFNANVTLKTQSQEKVRRSQAQEMMYKAFELLNPKSESKDVLNDADAFLKEVK